jgi:predicted PurR-regulated permease PerM
MTLPKRISYGFMAVMLILIGWLGLTTPLLTVLFSMFALHCLHHSRSKWLTVALFVVLVSGIFYSFIHFAGQAYVALPEIAERTIPVVLDYAQKQGLQLPFEDVASLKTMLLDEVKGELGRVGYYAKLALWEFAAFLIGLVVAISMFLNAKFDLGEEQHAVKDNLYSLTGAEIAERFRTFFRSFATVMGAQIVISSINTVLTGFYLFWIELPYAGVIVAITFLCGLLPIIGNILSNTLIVGVALTVSPQLALASLAFLVGIHKLEYFLNSKIIGDRIKNPMWLTLLGLVLGERLMGIPGMILAPVVLHYIKVEASQNRVEAENVRAVAREEAASTSPAQESGPAVAR